MATQAEAATFPRYAIGTPIFKPYTDSTWEKLPCPDCLGTGQWSATSPAGETFTLGCPRCGSYTYHDLPQLTVTRYVGRVRELVISGYEVGRDQAVQYKAGEPGDLNGFSRWTVGESDVIVDREAAQRQADLLAAVANTKQEATPEALRARHFGNMRLEAAQFDQFQNGLWAAHYHAANLIERVRFALFGTDDRDAEDLQAPEAVLEDLRSAASFDFDYHIDHLPLGTLIRAAAESSDPAVVEAMAKLPDTVVALFTKPVQPKPEDLPF